MANLTWNTSLEQPRLGNAPADEADYWVQVWRDHGVQTRHCDASRQVMRTYAGQPLSDVTLERIVDVVLQHLSLEPQFDVADLGCGNGLFSTAMAPHCHRILAYDISEELLATWSNSCPANVQQQVGDIRHFSEVDRFDRILVYAVAQYLSHSDLTRFLRQLYSALHTHGQILLGDLPDASRMWSFFNTHERRDAYFAGLENQRPLLGTWFDPQWLTHACEYIGFRQIRILEQPEHLPYAHFRFDALLSR